ncbi:hypothetical protein BD324DRAFT_369724 [Kockovaella imperatae]|uniref:Uncharacterized protein n=1 Tax=Kockovaella imperatae TaxID=4999 RepID=A0A1Y1UMB1_9TREE|nr:hypothetical protein BD324DRAFT_369724 [Kockovaella imperatae]ORX38616.1 hypothetical protein BD324DRAFT_369724 [Kockovaella imperatae]
MIQRTFPSSSPIQPVYEFVRTSLDPSASTKPFVLWQPPRFHYPEHPIPAKKENPHKAHIIAPASYGNIKGGPTQGLQGGTGGKESLSHLGLVPQSVLLIKWTEDKMNASGYKAPLRSDLLEKIVPLPPAQPKEEMSTKPSPASASATGAGNSTGEKKIPKWLQKGLLKKK